MQPEAQTALQAQAAQVFGSEPAYGLVRELLAKWGPIVGPILLKFILGLTANAEPTHANAVPAHALASPGALRIWVLTLLRSHKAELDEWLKSQVPELTEAGLAAMEGA